MTTAQQSSSTSLEKSTQLHQVARPQTKSPSEKLNQATKLRTAVNGYAAKTLKDKFLKSELRDECKHLPQFSLDEVNLGKFLGKGFFGMVYEVRGFNVGLERGGKTTHSPAPSVNKSFAPKTRRGLFKRLLFASKADSAEEEPEEFEDMMLRETYNRTNGKKIDGRTFMAQHCLRGPKGNARYAIKMLRKEVINDPTKLYYQGIMDINSETKLLSTVQHPNIIRLRAIATSATFADRFHDKYFIVLDRLYDVLEDRVHKNWKRRYKAIGGDSAWQRRLFDRKGRKQKQLWEERIVAVLDLSSALDYMHKRRIIHRDLKPDNIGFDIRNDVKIFDFGLAKELPPLEEANKDGAWKMTGETGTPRYMAPEVALNQSYDESSDTYTFCMLMWEIFALQTPFELYSMKSFKERVWQAPHKRPPLDNSWPQELRNLLEQGWSPAPSQRQPMSSVAETLEELVAACHEGTRLERASRRSTFVWEAEHSDSNGNLFALLSSPFGSLKSPSSRSFTGTGKKKGILDGTKETERMLSPSSSSFRESQLELSKRGSLRETPAGLPQSPPLVNGDDSSSEESEVGLSNGVTDGVIQNAKFGQHAGDANPVRGTDGDKHTASISTEGAGASQNLWQRIEEERRRRENIRAHIASVKAA